MKFQKFSLILENLLVLIIILNSLIGYPYSNMMIAHLIPINEFILFVVILLLLPMIPRLLVQYSLLQLLVLWSLLFLSRAFFDFYISKNIWVLRDAMHLVEIWWVFPMLYVLEKRGIEMFWRKLLLLFTLFVPIKLILLLLPGIESIVIQGVQSEIPLFLNKSAMLSIVFPMFFWVLLSFKKRKIWFTITIFSIISAQSRSAYLGFLLGMFFYTYINKKYVYFLRILGFLGICLYLLSKMSFLDDLTRFGVDKLDPISVFEHIISSFGIVLDPSFKGPASNVGLRLEWWLNILKMLFSRWDYLLFGKGFGMPLIGFYNSLGIVVREPHNSILSIFARMGMFGLSIWVYVWYRIWYKGIRLIFSPIISKEKNILFALLLSSPYFIVQMISEPLFELPFQATIMYIYFAILYYCTRHIRIFYYRAKYENIVSS